jgi:hypothetical protein
MAQAFEGITPASSGSSTAGTGVAPPQPMNSWSDVASAVAQPYVDKYNSLVNGVNNLSNAASQIGQGNALGAVNAARGVVSSDTQPANFLSSVTNPFSD